MVRAHLPSPRVRQTAAARRVRQTAAARGLVAASALLLLTGCAGDESELAALREQLEEREQLDADLQERLDTLEAERERTDERFDDVAGSGEVDRLAERLDRLRAAVDAVDEQLTEVTTSVDELRATADDAATEREELGSRIGGVSQELETVASELRESLRTVEGDAAGLADELAALRERVDVIQRRTQQPGAR